MVTADAMKELQMRMKVRDLSFSRDSTSWKNIPFISLWKRFPRLDGFELFDFLIDLVKECTLHTVGITWDSQTGPVFHSSPIKWSAS